MIIASMMGLTHRSLLLYEARQFGALPGCSFEVVKLAKGKWDEIRKRFPGIRKWLKAGLTQKQIINNLGISKTTFEAYKKSHPELSELLNKGHRTQVETVANSLFKLATGFYYYVDEVTKVKDASGNETVQVTRVQKFSAPQTDAAKYYLNNRDKENWAANPHMIDLRREEFELKKKHEEQFGEW